MYIFSLSRCRRGATALDEKKDDGNHELDPAGPAEPPEEVSMASRWREDPHEQRDGGELGSCKGEYPWHESYNGPMCDICTLLHRQGIQVPPVS